MAYGNGAVPEVAAAVALRLRMRMLLAVGIAVMGCADQRGDEAARAGGGDTASSAPRRGRLISATPIASKSDREIALALRDNGLGPTGSNAVDLYKIVYETIDPAGQKTIASGALAIPRGVAGALPLMSYQHGTVVNRGSVASAYGFDVESLLFGGGGYVVASPDYLGLGDSPGLHPYVHAASLATAVVDMLRAARAFCAERSVGLNGQIFLLGYSEGGYATMAAHKAIEEEYASEFAIAASAPMAGPYDMSGVMRDRFMSDAAYTQPFYMPYVVLAYNQVYHLADSLGAIFRAPYDKLLPGLFDGEQEGFDINRELPSQPKELFAPGYLAAFQRDSLHPLRQALRRNDLYDWTPRAPMRLYHCTADDLVPYANSEVAYNSFRSRGAAQVELVTLSDGGHMSCGYPAIIKGKEWFDSLKK